MKTLYRIANTRRALLAIVFILPISCERRTVIFGRMVDQNQRPVSGIMVLAAGTYYFDSERIHHTFTDKNGEYNMVIEVPEEYHELNAFIPNLCENWKYETRHKTVKMFKNSRRATSCCLAEIGKKTQWDFELEPK